MAINPLKGQVKLKLDKEFNARLTIDAIMQIETALDMGIIKLAQSMAEGDVRMSTIIQVLTPALRGGGNDVQADDVIKIVSEVGIVNSTREVANLLAMVLTADSGEDSKKKPEPAQ